MGLDYPKLFPGGQGSDAIAFVHAHDHNTLSIGVPDWEYHRRPHP